MRHLPRRNQMYLTFKSLEHPFGFFAKTLKHYQSLTTGQLNMSFVAITTEPKRYGTTTQTLIVSKSRATSSSLIPTLSLRKFHLMSHPRGRIMEMRLAHQ